MEQSSTVKFPKLFEPPPGGMEIIMRKITASLLCLVMLFAFCSCECEFSDFLELFEILETNESQPVPVNYDEMIGVYRDIIRVCQRYDGGKGTDYDYACELGIYSRCDEELYNDLFVSAYLFYAGRGQEDWTSPHYKLSCGYAIRDINRDGIDELVLLNEDYTIVAIFSMVNGTPTLLRNYKPRTICWIDAQGLLHESGSNGADSHSHAVYRIAQGGAKAEPVVEFGTSGHVWVDDVAVQQYYKLQGDLATEITEQEYKELNQAWKCCDAYTGAQENEKCAGLVFIPLFTESEIANETYQEALEGNIKIYDTASEKLVYLENCKTPYAQIPLCEVDDLQYAYADMDTNGISELVLECSGDILILRYYRSTVYLYSFPFRNMYALNLDGSYAWNHTGSDFEYGQNKLIFDGAKIIHMQLWKIVNDGEPNAAYYVGDQKVTQAELNKYIADHPTTPIAFSPLDSFWNAVITLDQAFEIAWKYWNRRYDIEKNGYIITDGVDPWAPNSVYVITLSTDDFTIATVWIDKTTGRITIPYDPNGK